MRATLWQERYETSGMRRKILQAVCAEAGIDLGFVCTGEEALAAARSGRARGHDVLIVDCSTGAPSDIGRCVDVATVARRAVYIIHPREDTFRDIERVVRALRGAEAPPLVWLPAGHYTQGEGDHTRLELYNSPVGNPDFKRGWHLRDLHIIPSAAQGTLAPADTPFGLQVAATSGGPALASLTNEDGVGLDVGLAAIDGAPPAAVAGQVGDDAITYTAPAAAQPSDVALRATVSGVDARVVLHSAKETGPFVFSLAPDARARLVQDPGGAVRVTRAITDYQDDGVTPAVITQTEFVVGRPVLVDSNGDPSAVASGPVTVTLTPASSPTSPAPAGPGQLTLAVDQAWLQDPRRVFPVRLDLPIATAESAAHSGTFGTVNSCAPDAPAPQADVVVGVENGCTYHGQVYFNLLSLLYDTPIVSATLRLRTPDQAGPTGVQVYPNTSPATDTLYQPAAWEQPSWNTAPAIAPGASGIAQGESRGHEQVWDVTGLVRQWVQSPRSNGGLTLVGSGAPVRFASALGAGSGKPGDAPSLDIVYAPRPSNPAFVDHPPHINVGQQAQSAVTPNFDAGASSIYGVAGDFEPNYYGPGTSQPTGAPYPTCGQRACGGITPEQTVAQAQPGGPGGSYVRLNASLECLSQGQSIDYNWWTTYGTASNPATANPFGIGALNDLIYTAGAEQLIPVITITPPSHGCPDGASYNTLTPLQWESEVSNFVDYMQGAYPHGATIYFEVGNEENYNGSQYYLSLSNYPLVFGAVAQGLQSRLSYWGFTNYHILTGGMLDPTAYYNTTGSCTAPGGDINIVDANNAIIKAENDYGVPSSVLGVAVHPYHYNTNESGYWENYYTEYGGTSGTNGYAGTCGDLLGMYQLWEGLFPGMPLVFTEDNWSTSFPKGNCSNFAGCEGTYLVDLFTWLNEHGISTTNSNVRVLVYRGADKDVAPGNTATGHDLGIYQRDGSEKPVTITYCAFNSVAGTHTISSNYYNLRNGACY